MSRAASHSSEVLEITARHYSSGEPVTLQIQDGIIVNFAGAYETSGDSLPWIAPGLVDLQLNGYGGLDFNSLPMTERMVGDITRLLWKEGVTTYYPTVITNSSEAILQSVSTICSAATQDSEANRAIAGIHLEGPFISPEDGPRGAHNRQYVQAPDWELFNQWQKAAGGLIRIVTVSPEYSNSAEFIARCTESGVTVAIGHTAATPEQIAGAVRAGAKMSTHLGNGCHLSLPRHPNYLWEQLAQDELWCCLIADGFHLPDQVLKVAFKMKQSRAVLVSDAVYLAGMPSGEYSTHVGGKVVLTPPGRLHLADNEKLLAGSAQMLLWGIEHTVRQGLAKLADAWEMSSVRPAQLMKLPSSIGLATGSPADLILFYVEGDRIRLERTYKHGILVYERG